MNVLPSCCSLKRPLASLLLCGCSLFVSGTVLDTARVHHIDEVVVVESFRSNEIRSAVPLQILSQKQLGRINALQVSDAVKHFTGVTVKDYGGIGGLKTVSVRSLGATHTAVVYDGVSLSDAQTGQIDIGRFSLDNVDMLSLANGQSGQIFQPARLFASAAVLSIKTLPPTFKEGERLKGQVRMKGGSFGMLNPSGYLHAQLHPKWQLAMSGEWLTSHGQYPYLLHYGSIGIDSTSVERRQNTDVNNWRAEAALYGAFKKGESANLKVYYYGSERGLPGATIFYNTANFSSQRVWDHTFFAQGNYTKQFSDRWDFQLNGKYNYGYLRYLDPVSLNEQGKEENTYLQQEYYLSASALYKVLPSLSLSLNSDGFINTLRANLPNFAYPTRYSWLTAFAAKYVHEYVVATGSVLVTAIQEQVQVGAAGSNYLRFSPYAGVVVKPLRRVDIRLRAFYKNIFRLPTFNDLYYSRVGNPNLKPETTNQLNVGATYQVKLGRVVPLFSVTADAYYNEVQNKIVAYPTKNIYTWTMLNYGKVQISGVDVTAELSIYPWEKIGVQLSSNYTYQRALNVTDTESREYLHQIPYTPRISGSGKAALETPWVEVAYSMVWSGHRYAVNQNYTENRVGGFVDHSLSVARRFKLKAVALEARLECLNLEGENYEVVRYFPMPGRSWRGTVSVEF